MSTNSFESLPSNPGSYNDFLEKHSLEHGIDAVRAMSEALAVYRSDLAEVRGFASVDELHDAPSVNLAGSANN